MTVSILGCGWLGLALGEHLVSRGHLVRGSTTSREKLDLLEKKEIDPYLLEFSPEPSDSGDSDFWESEVLIVNIPPGRNTNNPESYHPEQVRQIARLAGDGSIDFVLFVSSTSVYPDGAGVVSEDDAEPGSASRPSGEALLEAEQVLLSNDSFDTTVLRFGGLYGYGRHPVTYMAGRKNLDKGKAPVNLIHRDDCLEIIRLIIQTGLWGEIFNAVSDGHPPRKQYYVEAAKEKGLDPPTFRDDNGGSYKIVSNKKLKNALNYTFQYPNPMNFSVP